MNCTHQPAEKDAITTHRCDFPVTSVGCHRQWHRSSLGPNPVQVHLIWMDDLRPVCHVVLAICFPEFFSLFCTKSHQLLRPTPTLTNDDIEAVIQMATSSRPSPDGRSAPLKDTRTQLFVGNVRAILINPPVNCTYAGICYSCHTASAGKTSRTSSAARELFSVQMFP